MGESRGKKAKKGRWQLQVGLKELIFTGLGVAGLVMMSFALGTLTGRGDIYRVLHNWGLLAPDNGKASQIWHQAPPSSSTPVTAFSNPPPQEAPAPAKPDPPQATAADKAPTPAPVKGDIAAPPTPSPAKKQSPKQDAKVKEDKLDKIRREVASKLKFQNSLDISATKATPPGEKSRKSDGKEPKAASRPSTSQVMVAKFRDSRKAQTKMAEMRKQGEKVTLKEGKDSEGNYFAIYRLVTASPSGPPQVAHSQTKKPKIENKSNKSGTR